jgi:MinD superfamily P-loop ATPase
MRIAIASGKGGTGKTLVATNIFYILSERGEKVTLVDCDAEEPNSKAFFNTKEISESQVIQKVPVIDSDICTFCGKCVDYCSYNAIFLLHDRRIVRVMEDLCHGCGACLVACKMGAISEKEVSLGTVSKYSVNSESTIIEGKMRVGAYTPVPVIKASIKKSNNSEIVILDSPPGTSCPFIHTVSSADYILLVTEPTPFGLNDLKLSVEIVRDMRKPFSVIINRAGLGDRGVYNWLESEKIPVSMELPFNRDLAAIYSRGEIVSAVRPDVRNKFEMLTDSVLTIWK